MFAGETLLSNIYSRLRSKEKRTSTMTTCKLLNQEMHVLIQQGSQLSLDLDYLHSLTKDVQRIKYSSCQIPPTFLKLNAISCENNHVTSPKRNTICQLGRYTCRITTQWIERYQKSSTTCQHLCTPPTTKTKPVQKECAEKVEIELAIRPSDNYKSKNDQSISTNETSSKTLNVSIRWHGKGTEVAYRGPEDRLCIWSLSSLSSLSSQHSRDLLYETKVNNKNNIQYYNAFSKAGSLPVTLKFDAPVRSTIRKLVVRYERRLALNQGGCKWTAKNEVCGKTNLVIPYIPSKSFLFFPSI